MIIFKRSLTIKYFDMLILIYISAISIILSCNLPSITDMYNNHDDYISKAFKNLEKKQNNYFEQAKINEEIENDIKHTNQKEKPKGKNVKMKKSKSKVNSSIYSNFPDPKYMDEYLKTSSDDESSKDKYVSLEEEYIKNKKKKKKMNFNVECEGLDDFEMHYYYQKEKKEYSNYKYEYLPQQDKEKQEKIDSYFDILGLDKDKVSLKEIKKRHKILAKQFHPDSQNGNPDVDKFNRIQTAYEKIEAWYKKNNNL